MDNPNNSRSGCDRPSVVFDIHTARDFLSKLEADYSDFKLNSDSSRHALNCIITAYHLKDWVWRDWFENNEAQRKSLNLANKGAFESWLKTNWSGFDTVQSLANGAKRMIRPTTTPVSDRIEGYGRGRPTTTPVSDRIEGYGQEPSVLEQVFQRILPGINLA